MRSPELPKRFKTKVNKSPRKVIISYDEHTRQDLDRIVSNVIKNLPHDKTINIKTQFVSNPVKKLDFNQRVVNPTSEPSVTQETSVNQEVHYYRQFLENGRFSIYAQ